MKYIASILILASIGVTSAQVGIGTTNPTDASMLEVSGTSDGVNYKGLMPPRIPNITARNTIAPSATDVGLLIFLESTGCLQIWDGANWEDMHCISSGTIASDLFISEYVEGSGNNKALEIANFTGAPVNLDNYQLFISFNGGTSTSTITFNPGFILSDGAVYVVKNNAASGSITADQISNLVSFNGNDAVVLQTSAGVDIDILGTVGNSANYSVDETLRKNPATGPSTTYNPSDYTSFPIDTFSGLGNHTF